MLGSPGDIIISDSYEQWASREGIDSAVADADGDGLENVLEYAFATNPRVPGSLPSPQGINRSDASGLMTWEIESDIRRGGVRVIFEYSDDLSAWQEVPSDSLVGALDLTYSIKLPLSGGRKFLRARVVLEE